MPEPSMLDKFSITVDGVAISEEMERNIIEIVVDDSLHLPDMFSIRIQDQNLDWVDSDELKIGAEVEIWVTAADQGTRTGASGQLIIGEITAIAPNFSQTGEAMLVVQGYDRAHRLHRGKKSRSFLNVTDNEIAQRIARDARLNSETSVMSMRKSGQTNPASVVHDYVFQDNQTDLEFLQSRAQRIGFQVFVKDKVLFFGQSDAQQVEPVDLEWGKEMKTFMPRLTTMNQVDEVIVRGWNPETKEGIVSRAREGKIGPDVGISKSGSELAKEAFGIESQMVIVDQPVSGIDEANTLAQAMRDEISGDFIKADGICFGDPRITAGSLVNVEGVGIRFSGSYFVTSSTHVYNDEGYLTYFNISGRKPDTLSYLLQSENGNKKSWGIAIGLVTNNRDPKGWGRVKVKFPWLAETEESTWARIATPMAGQGTGFFFLPEINDEVLVAFEHGDINHPYVLGALWNGKDKPPRSNREVVGQDGKVNQRIIRSRSGHEIVFDDSRGKEKIIIRDKTGDNLIMIDSQQNSMTIKAKGNLVIKSDNEIEISGRRVKIKGDSIELN